MNVRVHSRRVPGRTLLYSAGALVSDGQHLSIFGARDIHQGFYPLLTMLPMVDIAELELDDDGAVTE